MDKTSIPRTLEALARGRIRYVGPPRRGAAALVSDLRLRERGRSFYRPQFHAIPEIICGLEGGLEIFINGRWTRWTAGKICVFLPGAVHSERYAEPTRRYRMFWTTLSAESIGFHITAYTPGRGYHLQGKRLALEHPQREPLLQAALWPGLAADRLRQIHFQSLLMETLYTAIPHMDKKSAGGSAVKVPYHHQVVAQVKTYLDGHFRTDVGVEELAGMVHYSPCHLNLLFRRQVGVPIGQYILKKRLEQAAHLLKTTDLEIKQIAYSIGFQDPLYFSRLFRRRFGIPARAYRFRR